jgi:glutamate--cysteine ligase
MKDWGDHLTTIFPEVRLKRYLEMRGADSGQWRRLCALPAFWVGLLYEDVALDGAWEIVKSWTAEERQTLRDAVPRQGFKAKIAGRTVADIAREALGLARQGLETRSLTGCKGRSEAQFLDVLDDIANAGRTQAEEFLDLYQGPWAGDASRVFRDFAF